MKILTERDYVRPRSRRTGFSRRDATDRRCPESQIVKQLVRCFFDYGIMIYASAFLDSRPLSDDELPPLGKFDLGGYSSDAALTLFAATVFVNLGTATFEDLGADVSSDAVKPLEENKCCASPPRSRPG